MLPLEIAGPRRRVVESVYRNDSSGRAVSSGDGFAPGLSVESGRSSPERGRVLHRLVSRSVSPWP